MAISVARSRGWKQEEGLSVLPRRCAVYQIMELSGGLSYIGVTGNLFDRISWHRTDPKGTIFSGRHELSYQLVSSTTKWDEIREWEQAKITKHQRTGVTLVSINGRCSTFQVNGVAFQVQKNETIEDAVQRAGLLDQFMGVFRR